MEFSTETEFRNLQTQSSLTGQTTRVNSFALYLMSLATMIGLYSLYARFLVPVLEGPPNISQRQEFHPPHVELSNRQYDRAKLSRLFPQDAWEHGESKVLLTEQGLILFKDFHRVEGGYLEVLPFTLVTKTAAPDSASDATQSPPTVLRCSRGARLKFDNPEEDPLSGKSSLESAWLVGMVDIFRPATGAEQDDSIEMVTSNVQLTKRQIFTIDEVQFAIGEHRGSGRQLSLEFTHGGEAIKPVGFEDITGVDRIELAYLKKLTLVPRSKSEVPPGRTSEPANQLNSAKFETVDITCSGPFVLDLNRNTATFNDQVAVIMQGEGRNEIGCKRLTVHFQRQVESLDKPGAAVDPETPLEGGTWDLEKLVAEGSPATFVSQEHAAKASGSILSYHAQRREIFAQQLPQFHEPVKIETPDFNFEAVQIAYKLKSDGGLGEMIAQGPGTVLRAESEQDRELLVRWNRVLTLEPEDGKHRITVDGGCQVCFDRTSEIQSQQIQVWLHEWVSDKVTVSGARKSNFEYQPDRILATGDVKMKSPQLNGTTERLTATWIPGQNPDDQQTFRLQTRRTGAFIAFQPTLEHSVNVQRSLRVPYSQRIAQAQQEADGMQPIHRQPSPVENPAVELAVPSQPIEAHPIRLAEHREPEPRKKRYNFKGDEVDLKLQQRATETIVQDLTASGNVLLSEIVPPTASSTTPPLVINGHQLRYVPQPDETARVLVTGSTTEAATVKTKQFQLRGNQIHLDQSANKLWVDGVGDVDFEPPAPAPVDPQSASLANSNQAGLENGSSAIGQSASQYDHVTVSWQSGMVFNGRKIYFEDGVSLTASGMNATGNSVRTLASGQGVTLELSQQVNFRDSDSDSKQDIEIREVVIVNQVAGSQRVFNYVNSNLDRNRTATPDASIAHQTIDPSGTTLEQQRFQAAQITLDVGSGLVSSKGPGFLAQHRRGGESLLKKANSPVVGNSAADSGIPVPSSSSGIVLVRVNFDGSANANLNEKRLTIRGNVRTLYSSVNSFDQILDPDLTQALPDDAVRVKSDRLEFSQWTPRDSKQPVQELLAAGNAHVTSDSFEATADQIRYNQATDTLVVEGTARSDAQLWYHPLATPRDRQHLIAQKIIYRPGDQSTEVQGIKNLDIRK